uniref:Uncharacterized protein n=1 Tax=Lygus hesperus TaxID=30085 RepID=A0A146LC60_LYGHE
MEALCSLRVEDSNNVSVHCAHVNAANILFNTTGEVDPAIALRLPLSPPICDSTPYSDGEDNLTSCPNRPPTVIPMSNYPRASLIKDVRASLQLTKYDSPDLSMRAPLRYVSFPRGAELLYGLPLTTVGTRYPTETFGQLEFTATLPALLQNKVSYGVRAGPGAIRMTHNQHKLIQPSSSSTSPDLVQRDGSTSLSGTQGVFRQTHVTQHTLDLS